MRVVVTGATGHIGSYLVPRLVAGGFEVVALSRGERKPYRERGEWRFVETRHINREEAEREGTFGRYVADLSPDAVIDLICYRLESCQHLVEALMGKVQHFLHCGTIWVHGPAEAVPTLESAPRRPFGEYGVQKAAIEAYLLKKARQEAFPATALHPGHIVGPGWAPINPAGNLDTAVFERLARGEVVTLPERGLATLHHVHADDVAQLFERALLHWSLAVGESFHVVSPQAVTLRGYAREVARWFGQEAKLEFLPWEAWKERVSEEHAAATLDHIAHSPSISIHKAQRLLGYTPRYSSFEAVREALSWLIEQGRIQVDTGP